MNQSTEYERAYAEGIRDAHLLSRIGDAIFAELMRENEKLRFQQAANDDARRKVEQKDASYRDLYLVWKWRCAVCFGVIGLLAMIFVMIVIARVGA